MGALNLFDDLERERVEFSPTEQVPVSKIDDPIDGLAPSKALVSSIQRFGIIEDLLLSRSGRRYTIIAGTRRFLAAKSIGLETVPAKTLTVKGGNRLSPNIIGLVTNRLRSQNLLSDVRFIERLRISGYAEPDIATITGLTIPELKRRDAIALGDHRITDLLSDGVVSPSLAERIAKLPINRQTELLDRFEASGDRRLTSRHFNEARLADTSVPDLPAGLFDVPCSSLSDLMAGRNFRVIVDDVEVQNQDGVWSVRRLGSDKAGIFDNEGDAVASAVKLLEAE